VYWIDNKGTVYGPFEPQADGFPNAGEVIRFYRKRLGWTQETFGLKLGVERLQVGNMENHNQVPQNLSRRRAIAKLLEIPPVLLGVGVIGSYLVPLEEAYSHTAVPSYSVQEANDYLNASWEACALTGSYSIIMGVRRQKARIEEQVARGGPEQSKHLELLHRYSHFLLEAGSRLQDYTETNPIELIDLARQVNNPDGLTTSLYHRAKMYFDRKDYKEALTDIREALFHIKQAGPQVRGVTLVGCGPILAHHATDKAGVREVMHFLDEAWKCIDPAKGYPDPFYRAFDESWYYLARASSILSLLRLDSHLIDDVFEALDLAKEQVNPTYTQRRTSIDLYYAEAAFHTRDYTSSVSTALEALELAWSINSVRATKRIQKLYNQLVQTKLKDSSELRKLRVALLKK
jgi:transcriptional regulator with XRE-family HTH domain